MEVSYIQLVKIDHDNNNVVVEPIDEQENIKHYVMDMLATISENIGEREYIFKDGEETMKTYLNSFIKEDNKDEITLNIAKPTGKVRILSVLVTIKGHIKLFQLETNVKIPRVIITGKANGIAILKNV